MDWKWACSNNAANVTVQATIHGQLWHGQPRVIIRLPICMVCHLPSKRPYHRKVRPLRVGTVHALASKLVALGPWQCHLDSRGLPIEPELVPCHSSHLQNVQWGRCTCNIPVPCLILIADDVQIFVGMTFHASPSFDHIWERTIPGP